MIGDKICNLLIIILCLLTFGLYFFDVRYWVNIVWFPVGFALGKALIGVLK